MAVILDGKKLRDKLLDELHLRTAKFDKKPKLVVILVGDNPASVIYVNNKRKFAEKAGIDSEIINYPSKVQEDELLNKIKELNEDNSVNGLLVQLPLPKHIDGYQYDFPNEGC